MSDGPADKPEKPPLPWDPTQPASPTDPTTAVPSLPADGAVPAAPAQPGLISAAPVGWAAPPPAAPVGWTDPAAAAPPPPSTGATVGWEPVSAAPQREVAPGLVFADTLSRFVAYFVDVILLGIVAGIVGSLLGFGRTTLTQGADDFGYRYQVTGAGFTVPIVVLGLAYFVFFWSGGRRATIGQRLFGIQVGNAFDGRPLSIVQAVKRWLGLGLFLSIFDLVAQPGQGWPTLLGFIWSVVLLVTTAMSPTKQGLHDKFANSALVRPANAGSRGLLLACAVIIGIFVVFAILGVILFLLAAGDIRDILSRIGDSI